MALEVGLLSRLLAYEQGRAQPCSSHRLVAIRPDAIVVSLLAMAGEDTTIHIAAYGEVGSTPAVRSVPDPRTRDEQYQLFRWLGEGLQDYCNKCRIAGTYPQIWVSSATAAAHLDTLADRLRFNKNDDNVRRFGEMLTYFTERYPVEGQQALRTATSALNLHWATGQDQSEDEHLLTLLTWIHPPQGLNVLAAVAQAERVPMGVKTDPEFDGDVLGPRVMSYNDARRSGTSQAMLAAKARLIHDALAQPVCRIYSAIQETIALVQNMNRDALSGLAELEQREAEEFAAFMHSRDADYHLPLRDSPKLAAFRLSAREDAVQNLRSAVLLGDRLARVQGRISGLVVKGEVINRARLRVRSHKFSYQFQLRSTQRVLKIRPRDELRWVADPRFHLIVTDVRRDGRTSVIQLEILKGQRSIGLPQIGVILELVPSVPDWDRLTRERGHLKTRLAVTPWTHTTSEIPASTSRRAPVDPLAVLEALR